MLQKQITAVLLCAFLFSLITPIPQAHGLTGTDVETHSNASLPAPGQMVSLSAAYQPAIIRGITVHKDNPFLFDFIVDVGDVGAGLAPAQNNRATARVAPTDMKKEGIKLVKYFLAALTIPEKDLWVNLSPYEKDRIIPNALGQTDMGRDLLAQDYILKQITASLIYPENGLGKEFWNRVYAKAQEQYGNIQIPMNTYNKVWIMGDSAQVYVKGNSAFVAECHLKVMLEEDYLALNKQNRGQRPIFSKNDLNFKNRALSPILRDLILPELEREVNQGKNFAQLRQIFNSIILASWYKNSLKESILNQAYANRSKIKGIDLDDKNVKQEIYNRYLQAYKKGVFNYIKEESFPPLEGGARLPAGVGKKGVVTPRKYFSGGVSPAMAVNPRRTLRLPSWIGATVMALTVQLSPNAALKQPNPNIHKMPYFYEQVNPGRQEDAAMLKDVPVVLTGATGFLGSGVLRALKLGGARSRALVWNSKEEDKLAVIVPEADSVTGGLTDVKQMKELVKGQKVMINIAADTRTGVNIDDHVESAKILSTNVLGPAIALLAAREENNEGMRKIFISSFDHTLVEKQEKEKREREERERKKRGKEQQAEPANEDEQKKSWVNSTAASIVQYAQDYFDGKNGMDPNDYFEKIVEDYTKNGYSVRPYSLSKALMDEVIRQMAENLHVKNVMVLKIMGPVGVEMAKSQAFGIVMRMVSAVLNKEVEENKVTPWYGASTSLIAVDDVVKVLSELSTVELSPEDQNQPLFLELAGPYWYLVDYKDGQERNHPGVLSVITDEAAKLGVSAEHLKKNIKIVIPKPGTEFVQEKPDFGPLERVLKRPVGKQLKPIEDVIREITRAVFDERVNARVDAIEDRFLENILPDHKERFRYFIRWFLRGYLSADDFLLKIVETVNKRELAGAILEMVKEERTKLPLRQSNAAKRLDDHAQVTFNALNNFLVTTKEDLRLILRTFDALKDLDDLDQLYSQRFDLGDAEHQVFEYYTLFNVYLQWIEDFLNGQPLEAVLEDSNFLKELKEKVLLTLPRMKSFLEHRGQGFAKAAVHVQAIQEAINNFLLDESTSSAMTSAAARKVDGGIDLQASRMKWDVKGDQVQMKVDQAMIEQIRLKGIASLTPEIIGIMPVVDIEAFIRKGG